MRGWVVLALAALAALGWAAPGGAQEEGGVLEAAVGGAEGDWLVADGPLSSVDFYRMVSCRALPGGPCTVESVAWPPERAARLTVGVVDAPPAYPRDLARRVGKALDAALAQINGAGAGLHLVRARKGERADVTLRFSAVREGDPIEGTGIQGVDGEEIGAALVTVWWDERLRITEAVIVVAADLAPDEADSVILEELTQAMGLLTDVRGRAYEGVSVFSEDSNAAVRLGPQDVEALRMHYPPGEP